MVKNIVLVLIFLNGLNSFLIKNMDYEDEEDELFFIEDPIRGQFYSYINGSYEGVVVVTHIIKHVRTDVLTAPHGSSKPRKRNVSHRP